MLKYADHIIVLDNGKIIESGVYDNLIKMNGLLSRFSNSNVV